MIYVNSKDDRISELSYERALEEVRRLSSMQRHDSGGVEVYSGNHPQFGNVHIVLPPAGCGLLLLPFVIQQF